MPAAGQKFLGEMLDRLYAALSNGPSLNCRPHASRQRLDFQLLAQLGDEPGNALLARLLSAEKAVKLTVKTLPKLPDPTADEATLTAEQQALRRAWKQQESALTKLRAIAEDARTFEQDTGAHVLFVGYPLLHLPPGRSSGKGAAKRVLAPIAFIPIDLALSRGRTTTLQLGCLGEGAERVVPNTALLAWIARETGQRAEELSDDEAGGDPFKEINALVGYVRKALGLPAVTDLGPETPLTTAPRRDDEDADETKVYSAAVLGLFPHSNQSLIADMEALIGGEPLQGPGEAFVNIRTNGEAPPATPLAALQPAAHPLPDTMLVAAADPCQTKTIRLARQANILVVHGPPGTGKSQTIANMIGDYLARGERVLLVCDKRVALDVVYYRLDRLGLGQLCAVVHDAQSDQRELYRGVRDQLDGLVEAKAVASAPGKLGTTTRELAKVHGELSDCFRAVQQRPDADTPSFHELMGAWLDLEAPEALDVPDEPLADVALVDGLAQEKPIREVLQRGLSADFADNPWTPAAGIALPDFLGQSLNHWKSVLAGLAKAAQELDATCDPAIPPFSAEGDVTALAATRAAFGETLGKAWQTVEQPGIQHWAKQEARAIEATLMAFDGQAAFLTVFQQGRLDAELFAVQRESPLKSAQITAWLTTLESYLAIASLWYGFLYFQRKSAASEVLRHFGLTLSAASASRVRTFLIGVRARNALIDWHDTALSPTPLANRHNDGTLQKALDDARAVLTALQRLRTEPALQPLTDAVIAAMLEPSKREALLRGLQLGPGRAKAIALNETKLAEARLFNAGWLADTRQRLRQGEPLAPLVRDLTEQLSSLEGIVRIRQALGQLPGGVAKAVEALLAQGPEVEDGWNAFHKAVVHAEITRRIKNAPALQAVDGEQLQSLFERYRELDEKKKALTRDSILTHWVGKQKDRLLAGTGSRLNSLGADLRRRLFLRGERAMRLRQVIKIGAEIEGGDPLFDMRPVWMAGPATVAELFARKPLFDAVIFDEASQCRLEEALPVLTRGKRVVIAGDPQQLPPTRFFESALVQSEDDAEPDSDQALFESQQAEADDLLSAALNLSVEQSYLDVHYRSRHADLIEFSNRNFYESRLQPIPGHPANRLPHAPLKLHRVNGVYEQRTNPAEAKRVVEIVRELLGRKEPPSVGIACFNIAQRDLILDALDEASAGDEAFAERLAESRSRTGSGSFEGLFVRNLENVQGDERDCMIISTTYGPDPQGRFYRRFGPLGRAGGGRRLNVLITRARQEVHLVTSFPPEVYRSLPTVPPGSVPTGGWLLFAYLNYAEQLQGAYEASGGRKPAVASETASSRPPLASVDERPMPSPSRFAEALAEELAKKHNLSSTVHWGNEGFCVDVALRDPENPANVALGILCDGSRYGKADDPVEWDVFRTAILESQGWKLHRLWTPQFARDADSAEQAILALLAGPKGEGRGRGAARRK